MTPVALLKATRELIAKSYCSGWFAKNKYDEPVEIHDETAETFCVLGGMHKLNPYPRGSDQHLALHLEAKMLLSMITGSVSITSDRGQSEALDMLDAGIHYGENNPHPFTTNAEGSE